MAIDSATDPQFAEAHRRLLEDGGIQTQFVAPPEPTRPPEWLRALGELIQPVLEAIGKAFAWLFSFLPEGSVLYYVLIGALIAVGLFATYLALQYWLEDRGRRQQGADGQSDDWQPEQAAARRWLDEAEALAAQGRWSEAVHHLLFRSIADIERRRPDLVRPASTSRDIAAAPTIPGPARGFFATIANAVERSLFGGRDLGEHDWTSARKAYEHFALPDTWQR